MYGSVLAIALSGIFGAAALDTPAWSTDYRSAQKLGSEGGKPLAVFIGSGKAGWDRISKTGKLDEEVNRVLAANYVCVYIDTTEDPGKLLAADFEVTDDLGLVISDRAGGLQAFRHEGELGSQDLVRCLKRYADPDRVVRATESIPSPWVSYYLYGTDSARTQNYVQPIYSSPSFSSGGRSC